MTLGNVVAHVSGREQWEGASVEVGMAMATANSQRDIRREGEGARGREMVGQNLPHIHEEKGVGGRKGCQRKGENRAH